MGSEGHTRGEGESCHLTDRQTGGHRLAASPPRRLAASPHCRSTVTLASRLLRRGHGVIYGGVVYGVVSHEEDSMPTCTRMPAAQRRVLSLARSLARRAEEPRVRV